jgi:putative Holliday junction resolvase
LRVLALDYGAARCGVAVSDPSGTLATPLEPVLRPGSKHGFAALRELVAALGVERVIVGLPLSLSGADSAQTRETRTSLDSRAAAVLLDEWLNTRAGPY